MGVKGVCHETSFCVVTHNSTNKIIFLMAYMKALAAFVQLKFKRTNIAVCYICNFDVVL
jgi:hypothetical protein